MRRALLALAALAVAAVGAWLASRSPGQPEPVGSAAPQGPSRGERPPPARTEQLEAPDSGPFLANPALEAPLRAVGPELRLCFEERREHVREQVTLKVTFRPTPDGGFDGVRVESSNLQDPTFAACVEDVFDEVRFQPTGREAFVPVTHTFSFEPPRR